MFEAMLFVCLTMVTTPDPCLFMNVVHRELNSSAQCHFWLEQGVTQITTREHYEAIKQKLGTIGSQLDSYEDTQFYIKGECREQVILKPFVCAECDT
jgi:hypothetical protein